MALRDMALEGFIKYAARGLPTTSSAVWSSCCPPIAQQSRQLHLVYPKDRQPMPKLSR
jgi:hypothetical protein